MSNSEPNPCTYIGPYFGTNSRTNDTDIGPDSDTYIGTDTYPYTALTRAHPRRPWHGWCVVGGLQPGRRVRGHWLR
jgi:hypothetical protein